MIMQDKIDGESHRITRRYSTKEERQTHVQSWKKSGLTMSKYCRQYNLSVAVDSVPNRRKLREEFYPPKKSPK
jgi:hypothetical protein